MKIYHNPTTITFTARHDLTLELAPGERITLPPAAVLELVEGPNAYTFDDGAVSFSETGRYWFRVTDATGERHDVRLICFQPELLDFAARQVRSLGHGGEIVDALKVRAIVRSLCTTPWFDGTIASCTTGDATRALTNHGA